MRRINLSFGLGLFLLLFVFIVSYVTLNEIIDAGITERRVFQIQAKINNIRNPLKDAEVGHRGFLLTGQESYLKKYSTASKILQKEVPLLASQLKGDSTQTKNIDRLKTLIAQRFNEMDVAIEKMRAGNEQLALDLFFKGNNSNKMDQILDLLDNFDNEQERIIQSQSSEIGLHSKRAVRIVVLGSAIAFTIVLLAAYYFYDERKKRIKTEIGIRAAREEAIRASHAKSEFLANVSHEIRTPLNGIISTADLFENSVDLKPGDKTFVRIIRSSGEALLRIVNDILDFSKVEAGKLTLEASVFSPETVAHSATELFQARAAKKQIPLIFSKSDDLPSQALGDAGRITQVLANLIGNALKFSDHGEIRVRASLYSDDQHHKFIKFSVQDKGPGMDDSIKAALFEPFSQSTGQSMKRHGGTGLGLAICKKLVDLMKGSIGFESEFGSGSIFYFEIPYVVPAYGSVLPIQVDYLTESESPSVLENENANEYRYKDLLVLVAEDNSTNQIVIKEHLKRFGIPAHVVANGKEALQAFKARSYNMIFMDCQMPEMDGFEASQEIKKLNPDVPIIAMTASALTGDKEKCIAAGMKTQLIKPIRRGDLELTLNSHLPEFSKSRMDWDVLKILAAQTDKGVVKKVIVSFLETMPQLLSKLKVAAENPESGDLKKIAHLLKSGSSTIGAVALSKLCEDIELFSMDGKIKNIPSAVTQLMTEAANIKEELQGWQGHL